MPLPIIASPDYDAPLPPGHRFPMGKFRALAAILQARGLVQNPVDAVAGNGFACPEPAGEDLLCLAHDRAYVRRVLAQMLHPQEERRIGLPVTADVARRACAAVGGTLLTARLALEHGLACNTAGGSHHAAHAGGAGFCVFNDVAVAALALLAERAVGRVLIVDLDVHQGDGTALILAHEPRAFTFSMHCEANFPSVKPASDLDIGLPRGAGDDEYLGALDEALPRAIAAARPDLIFYNAGVDVHRDDSLGHLQLSDAGLAAREQMVLAAAQAHAVALASVLGGGYGPDVQAVALRHAVFPTLAAALAHAQRT